MPKFYVIYGFGTNLRNNYSEVEAENYKAARERVFAATDKGLFAFMYNEEEFTGQAERFCLTPVELQPQVYI